MINRKLYTGFIISTLIIVGILFYWQNSPVSNKGLIFSGIEQPDAIKPEGVAQNEIILPVIWGNLGVRMVTSGVIDAKKIEAVYQSQGGLSLEEKNILYGSKNEYLKINSQDSGFVLNVLWALGLGNKNEILDKGQMTDARYGGAENFASTAGWTVSNGEVMSHYSRHVFVALTSEQQNLVFSVAQNIYRPCCGNNTLVSPIAIMEWQCWDYWSLWLSGC